jgi:hypothetical protein
MHGLHKLFYNMSCVVLNKQISKKLTFSLKCDMKKIKLNFYEYIWCTKKMPQIGMYELYKDLCHCAILIFRQDLTSSLTIANWCQV